jgi:indole-3-glycerol phosphate synthase
MEPLVESHTDADLDRVLATDARIVGVNARDLDIAGRRRRGRAGRTRRIRPTGSRCSESGIRTPEDVTRAVGPPVRLPSW